MSFLRDGNLDPNGMSIELRLPITGATFDARCSRSSVFFDKKDHREPESRFDFSLTFGELAERSVGGGNVGKLGMVTLG